MNGSLVLRNALRYIYVESRKYDRFNFYWYYKQARKEKREREEDEEGDREISDR